MDEFKTISKMRNYLAFNEKRAGFQNFMKANDKDAVDLVKIGHKVAKMYQSKKYNKISDADMSNHDRRFASLFNDVKSDKYKEINDKFMYTLCRYSAKKTGMDVANFDINAVKNPNLTSKTLFKETFDSVLVQVMTPIVPALVSAAFLEMADVQNVGFGDNGKFRVRSNDTFYVTRQAEGVLEGSVQRIYDKEFTVNATPYSIKTTVNWYHVASGLFDFGVFVDRVAQSYANFVSQMVIQAITKDVTANISASSPYFTNGFTTPKWNTLVDRLKAANGNALDITAFGSRSALSAIIPSQVGLQYGLGEEWTSVGYLYKYMGVDLVSIPQILLPNTVNTSALFGIPNDTIWLFANGGYKPVKLLFEGEAITKDYVPTESADMEMGIEIIFRIGQGFMAASKYGAITGVTLSA